MIVKTLAVGPLEANCYIIADEETGQALVVDPGDEPDRLLEEADGLDVRYIVLTHAHFDHVGAVGDVKEATGAQIVLHEADLPVYESSKSHAAVWGYQMDPPPQPDLLVNEGDELMLGSLSFVVIHTPGHSPGSMCLYSEGVVFTGDTLFAGSVGRADLPGGDMGLLKQSFRRLMSLPNETAVLSGHGPASSIGREKAENLFAAEFMG